MKRLLKLLIIVAYYIKDLNNFLNSDDLILVDNLVKII